MALDSCFEPRPPVRKGGECFRWKRALAALDPTLAPRGEVPAAAGVNEDSAPAENAAAEGLHIEAKWTVFFPLILSIKQKHRVDRTSFCRSSLKNSISNRIKDVDFYFVLLHLSLSSPKMGSNILLKFETSK